jgi:TonB-linked SusC/RagA family outer membrane protein
MVKSSKKFFNMRLNIIKYNKLRFAGLLLMCLFIGLPLNAQGQKEKKVRQTVDVTVKVVDESGTAVPGAQVVIGEGVTHTETNAEGTVTFKAYPEEFITITSPVFEKSVSVVMDVMQTGTVKLLKSKMYMTSKDIVPLPFTPLKKRHITGPEITIDAERLEKYPSNDLRTAFTGLTSGLDVRELYGWPGISAQENLGAFDATDKFSNMPVAIVDGLYTDLSEMSLDIAEIESITFNKGILANAMFGPVAGLGSIYIKTKHGVKNERILKVNLESGISTIDRMPGWVSGGDYARLNNYARNADELAANYSDEDIAAYDKNDPYDLYHPSINFQEMMLKNSMSFKRANVSSSGGNDIVQYFSYIGYAGEGDIYKLGSKSNYNKISTRQNVDVKINDAFSVSINFYGNINVRNSPNYGYDSDFTSENSSSNPALGLMELPSVLDDIHSVPPIAFPVYASFDPNLTIPAYGVTADYSVNPIGNLVSQGYYNETGRMGSTNVMLNFDMGSFVKGLKSTTYLGFNIYNLVRLGQVEDYVAGIVKTDPDTIVEASSHSLANQTSMSKLMDYYYQRFGVYENLEFNRTFGDHTLQSNLTVYFGKTFKNGIEEPERQLNTILHSMYAFKDKYSAELVLNYSGTYSFDKNKRYKLFPSAGLGWVVSDEGFMSGISAINFLKLRAQYGIIGVERFLSPFYYMDRWSVNNSGSAFGPFSSNQWFGTSTDANVRRSNPQRIGNTDLGWEILKEFNTGFDALLFNQKLSLAVTYKNSTDDGTVVQVSNEMPLSAGLNGSRPYINYTKINRQAVMTDLMFTQKVGNVMVSVGGNLTTQVSERLKYDEPNYRFDYQKRTGRPEDAIFGLTYVGKFGSDLETYDVPQLFDSELRAGDLKYADLNSDGFVDDSDQGMIGHSSPRLYYGLNAQVRYKNFEFFIHGAGRAFYDLALTNSYYWNGWGDNTYSNFVNENNGGAYPRLTYYKVNNNFMTSDFWLTKGDYFKIQNVELAYTIPAKALQFIGSRGIRLYVRGANLLTISKIKDVDPESINSGVSNYPLFRTFTGGLKLNF